MASGTHCSFKIRVHPLYSATWSIWLLKIIIVALDYRYYNQQIWRPCGCYSAFVGRTICWPPDLGFNHLNLLISDRENCFASYTCCEQLMHQILTLRVTSFLCSSRSTGDYKYKLNLSFPLFTSPFLSFPFLPLPFLPLWAPSPFPKSS